MLNYYLTGNTIVKHLFWATKRRHFTPELTINTETSHLIGQKYLTTQSEWMKSTVSEWNTAYGTPDLSRLILVRLRWAGEKRQTSTQSRDPARKQGVSSTVRASSSGPHTSQDNSFRLHAAGNVNSKPVLQKRFCLFSKMSLYL